MAARRTWALERNDRRSALAAGAEMTVYAEDGGFGVGRHKGPAWKVVLGRGGPVEALLGGGRRGGRGGRVGGAGIIVPPETGHLCTAAGAFTAFFVDPWLLRPAAGPVPLDRDEVRRLLAALGPPGGAPDTSAAFAELTRVTGAGAPLDPRVEYAVGASMSMRAAGEAGRIGAIAADVGLSPVRLRALVGASVGVPLVRLRSWARLRWAIGRLADGSAADAAAEAGFADQAHFTRTAGGLLGRTPGSLREHLSR
ncbi:helix-turn-helix domain-containing protein [Nocardiopsis potens]|uniref:helix-turn-helix domain-containing protein n=1 Tax=Nocardiopsis potens TaxID=1246458 RepID=UPI00034AFB63|nr:helix-turn-helix domain-containing protein [Nocardiopsis potens]